MDNVILFLIIVAGFLVFVWLVYIGEGTKELKQQLSAARESLKRQHIIIDDLNKQLKEYSASFGALTEENIKKRNAEWDSELRMRLSQTKNAYDARLSVLNEEFERKKSEAEKSLINIQNECEELAKKDIRLFYSEMLSLVYPEEIAAAHAEYFDENILNLTENESFAELRKDLYEKIHIIEQYSSRLDRAVKGLSDRKYSACVYTTLAEAFSNRIIADWYKKNFDQNTLFPPVARISAELQTLWLSDLAQKLSWGNDQARYRKVQSIIEIKRTAKEQIESANCARYQFEYLLSLYPQLQDILDIKYNDLDFASSEIPTEESHDSVRDYLSREEYMSLSETERNQLALDRYVQSRKKTKWQIGRDYELYIGYLCEKQGYKVEYTGSTMRLEDLGRDLIVSGFDTVYIIQCKYWSSDKSIHEKHIMQLFGTTTEYRITHPDCFNVISVFVTSAKLSDTAKLFAEELGVMVYERRPINNYPRIKCNINTNEFGEKTYIYHLPMDLSYDATKIDNPGEFMAYTVKEAENSGFRRSYKWHGN